ncbi:MAG: hypothetical protein KA886_03100 [Candidatus Cloacimonetes bacterium]|nr:hypothetical protein [Candidatus Cloacimonadota bacterium]
MKHNRWFVYLVGILLIINLSIYAAFKYFDAASYFRNRISLMLESSLDANVSLDQFSINEKQMFISNLKLDDKQGQFQIRVKHLYVDYNLLFVLLSNISKAKAIKEIRIYEPDVIYRYQAKKKTNTSNTDYTKWFKKLKVENGKLKIVSGLKIIKFESQLDSIDIQINNEKQSEIQLNAHTSEHSKLKLYSVLEKNRLKKLKATVSDLRLNHLIIDSKLILNCKSSAMIDFDSRQWLYDVQLHDLDLAIQDETLKNILSVNHLFPERFRLYGNQNKAFLNTKVKSDTDLNLLLEMTVSDPFKNRKISLDYVINHFQLPKMTHVEGKINAEGTLKWNGKIGVEGIVLSDSLTFKDETAKAIQLSVKTDDLLNGKIKFQSNEMQLFKGRTSFSGNYSLKNNQIESDIQCSEIAYDFKGLSLMGNISSTVQYQKKSFTLKNKIEGARFSYQSYEMDQLYGDIFISNNQYEVDLENTEKSFELAYQGSLQDKEHHFDLVLDNFHLKKIKGDFADLPVNGKIQVNLKDGRLKSLLNMSIPKNNTIAFQGDFDAEFNADINEKKTNLDCVLKKGYFNKKAIQFSLKADGTLDSLKSSEFIINKELQLNVSAGLSPFFFYRIETQNQIIPLSMISQYFVDEDVKQNLKGYLQINRLFYDSSKEKSLKADIAVNKLQYTISREFNIKSNISGDLDDIQINRFEVSGGDKRLLNAEGRIEDFGKNLSIEAGLNGELSEFADLPDSKGLLNASLEFNLKDGAKTFKAKLATEELLLYNQYLNRVNLNVEQLEKELVFNEISVGSNMYYSINGKGSIAYNVLQDQTYESHKSLRLDLKLDPLGYLSNEYDLMNQTQSQLTGFAEVSMNEEGLLIKSAELNMQNGKVKLQSQPEIIDKISLKMNVLNNRLDLKQFSFRMGKGIVNIRNEIKHNEEDFILGNVQIGHLYVSSDNEGIFMHVPYYSPKNSVANIKVKGRSNNEFEIKGPFDDIHLTGDIIFSNGTGIYPSDSENLLQYLNQIMARNQMRRNEKKQLEPEDKQETESSDYPFTLDLVLRFANNMRYVTYPLNLEVNPDSYLELTYKKGRWGVNSASFISESGEVELFGTIFKADYVSVKITPYDYNPIVLGSFYKKAPDGTTIFLEISSDPSISNFMESMTISLKSDNSDDKNAAQILSKLRYGKSLDELSSQQEQSILQDEALQLFGVGLGSAFVDPYITPFETKVRKWFNLDTFNINPGFVQNLFNEYKSDNHAKLRGTDKDIISFSSSILLNNLSINSGRYISNIVFFNYEAIFQEETDIFENNRLYMYNNFSLRYDLPFKIQGIYEFQLIPDNKKEAHEIFFMRSFKF